MMRLDRYFFKHNKSFCLQTIYSSLPPKQSWQAPPLTELEAHQLRILTAQKFHYIARGGQSSVFMSEDKSCVLKFYRFPSHLRPLGWLKHPIAYKFSSKRKEIESHNFEKLGITFGSFKLAFEHLKEESGLLYLHLNPTPDAPHPVTIVDHLGSEYVIDLSRVSYLLQARADGIFRTLETYHQRGDTAATKALIDSIVSLIATRCQKGITDNDALLEQNYGVSNGKAIHVDVGRLAFAPEMRDPRKMKAHLNQMVWKLREWLQERSPEMKNYLDKRIEQTLATSASMGTCVCSPDAMFFSMTSPFSNSGSSAITKS